MGCHHRASVSRGRRHGAPDSPRPLPRRWPDGSRQSCRRDGRPVADMVTAERFAKSRKVGVAIGSAATASQQANMAKVCLVIADSSVGSRFAYTRCYAVCCWYTGAGRGR